MKTRTMTMIALMFLLVSAPFASGQMMGGGMMQDSPMSMHQMTQEQMRMLMQENEQMMAMMHSMMDRFKEMSKDEKGRAEMEEMMQNMGQMMTRHRMNMMMRENAQMMKMMHGMMGHLEDMPMDGQGKQKMKEMKQQMDQMMKKHEAARKQMGKSSWPE